MSKENFNELRRKAEERLAGRERQIESLERADLAKIAHELAVHQVELEIQNEELRRTRTAAEEARDRYLDLYDFAPVGYFTVDEHSRVVEANLTASHLLKMETRRNLLKTRFTKFIHPEESDRFHFHQRKALESESRQTLELKMQKADGTSFDAQLISVKAGPGRIRIAVIDITERKKMEEALVKAVEREAAVSILASKLASSISIADISELVLESAERLTRSTSGFVGYKDLETGYMISPAMTRGIWETSQGKDETKIFNDFVGVWGWVLDNRQSLLTNAPADDPRFAETAPGRKAIHNFLSAPALIGTELVGQVALANSNPSYNQQDLGFVERLATLYAIAIQNQRTEDKIRKLAYHDPLTGLPNRSLFNDRYAIALAGAQRYHKKIGLMVLDIDHFKNINDTLGHGAGDEVLKDFSGKLHRILRKTDTVMRLGGDEFVIMMTDVVEPEQIANVAQKILEATRKPFMFHDHEVRITASIGISSYPEDGEDVEMLLKCADIAMYHVKEKGRDNYTRYVPGMEETAPAYYAKLALPPLSRKLLR